MKNSNNGDRRVYLFFKRLLDIVVSLSGILLLSPLFLFIVIMIRLDSKGSVIFKQQRFGRYRKPFTIYKFRTMILDAPPELPTYMIKDPDHLITGVGKLLRRSSLDEMPQLFNILKGDISIVGPRPVILSETDLIDERDKYEANSIRPGLTGWAQINGRDTLSYIEKARLDGEYLQKMNLCFDLKCFLRTITSVIKADGLVEGGPVKHKKTDETKRSQ